MAADRSQTEELVDRDIDRSIGHSRDQRQGVVRDERTLLAVGEEGQKEHDALRWQLGDRLQKSRHRQVGEVCDGYARLEPLEITPRNALELPVERGHSSHDEDTSSFRLQAQGDVKRGCEVASHEDAGHVRPQRLAFEIRRIGATEHDGNTWEHQLPVSQQKVQGRPQDRDDQVQSRIRVLASKVIAQHDVVVRAPELRQVQRLTVELYVARELRGEGLAQAPIDDRQARKVLVLVEQQQDLRPGVRGVRQHKGAQQHHADEDSGPDDEQTVTFGGDERRRRQGSRTRMARRSCHAP